MGHDRPGPFRDQNHTGRRPTSPPRRPHPRPRIRRAARRPTASRSPAWQSGVPLDIGADIQRSLAHPGWLAYDQITPLRTRTSAAKSAPLQPARLVLPIGTASGIPLKSPAPSTSRARAIWVNHLGVDPMSALRAATCWPRPAMKVDQDVGPPP